MRKCDVVLCARACVHVCVCVCRDPRWGRGQETPGEGIHYSSVVSCMYVPNSELLSMV